MNINVDRILNQFDKGITIQYLKELVRIPSISNEEKALAEYIGDRLKTIGLCVSYQDVGENSRNVVGILKGQSPGPNIMLIGHLDTVPPTEGWETNPFEPIEQGDRIYGLGSADMKGGIATILSVVEIIKRNSIEINGNLIVCFVADEEGHSKGIKILLESDVKADVAFMVEPQFNSAVVGAVGKMLLKCKVVGEACHMANASNGINAIEEACKYVDRLSEIELYHHEKFGYQSFIAMKFNGGYEKYSITLPDSCTFTLNKFLVPGENKEDILSKLVELKTKLKLRGDFNFEIAEPFYEPYIINEDLDYFNTLKKIYKETTNNELISEYSTGVSDSNCLVNIGKIPTINFGPSGGPIHAPNEWVSKNEIFTCINIYLKLILHYLS